MNLLLFAAMSGFTAMSGFAAMSGSPSAPASIDLTRLLAALALLLVVARGLGEVARRLNQPAVLGELLAGILLGPSILGRASPAIASWLFPAEGSNVVVLDGIRTLSMVLFLLAAGLEIDLTTVFKQGRKATVVSILGIAAPFALGLLVASLAPGAVGFEIGSDRTIFTLFFATALSISALPVIAKTLMDLYLYRTELGMTVISAAMLDDLLGWTIFAAILGLAGAPGSHRPIGVVIGSTLAFAVSALTLVRLGIHRALPWVQAHTAFPGGVIAFAIALGLGGAALTEWIGIEAVFGAFLAGVALGGSSHLRERTRATIGEFVSSFFAPIFFASIGLKVDFVSHFDPILVLSVIAIACLGKIGACAAGARLAGLAARESWAIGFAMNARGMMEIVLGLAALRQGLIGERLFVALVSMALFTSVLAGPAIQATLGRRKPRRFAALLSAKTFVGMLASRDRLAAIGELSLVLGRASGIEAARIEAAVCANEEIGATDIGHGVAILHARLDGLGEPLVAFGRSTAGIDFNAPDGEPARLVFLALTSTEEPAAELEILADIGRTLADPGTRDRVLTAAGFTEILAVLRTEPGGESRS